MIEKLQDELKDILRTFLNLKKKKKKKNSEKLKRTSTAATTQFVWKNS